MKIIFHDVKDGCVVHEEDFETEFQICRILCGPNGKPTIFNCKVMSRNHALISHKNDKFYLKDLKSSNGTFVNENRLEPQTDTEIFTNDILQFGVSVGCHPPLKSRIEILDNSLTRYVDRNGKSDNSDTDDVNDVNVKLNNVEAILAILRPIYRQTSNGKEVLGNLKMISQSIENLHSLIENKIFKQHEIEISMKRILNDLINEVVLSNLVQEEKQKELIQMITTKFGDLSQSIDKRFHSSSSALFLSNSAVLPSISFPEAEDDGFVPEFCEDEDKENSSSLKRKGILKRKSSTMSTASRRSSASSVHINDIPEVKEIENCLMDDCLDEFDNKLILYSSEKNETRKRNWTKVQVSVKQQQNAQKTKLEETLDSIKTLTRENQLNINQVIK